MNKEQLHDYTSAAVPDFPHLVSSTVTSALPNTHLDIQLSRYDGHAGSYSASTLWDGSCLFAPRAVLVKHFNKTILACMPLSLTPSGVT